MIEFSRLQPPPPHDFADSVYVLLHGRPIGSIRSAADGRRAGVYAGVGLDSEGIGDVYSRDRYGRPQCIYRAAADLILREGGHPERIIDSPNP